MTSRCLQKMMEILQVTEDEVRKRLSTCKKPRGLLPGDLYPDLLTRYSGKLAPIVTDVFNACFRQELWPDVWKVEQVTIIPKTAHPETLNEVRNISCTPVLSKVMEYFVLRRLKEEIKPKVNQYGGITGCGTTHYLLQAWNDILEALDEDESAVSLISIDFAKAFNTMGHQACIRSIVGHGASKHSARLVSSFLLRRMMKFKINDVLSTPRLLRGGSPQGTLLGNFMFVIAADNLEDRQVNPTPTHLMDRTPLWDPDAVHGTPIRRRPSAIMPGLNGVLTSSPAAPGVVRRFHPDFDEVDPLDVSSEDSSFLHLRNCNEPINRIHDTPSKSIRILSRSVMEEANPRPSNWTSAPIAINKYVDDFLGGEKLSTYAGAFHFSASRPILRLHAPQCQDFFNTVSLNAKSVGMSVNQKKTQMICIASACGREVESFISTDEGPIESQKRLKILGFTFGNRPNADAHMETMTTKFKTRIWLLRNLRKAGVPKEDLTKLYHILVVPVLDFAAIVYHYLLTAEQSKELERLQATALKIIWGFKHSYAQLLEMSGTDPLHERRLKLIDKFLVKTVQNDRFRNEWFKTKTFCHHNLRRERFYEEKYAKTERLYSSPLYSMRRRLNEGIIPGIKPPDGPSDDAED